jgi:hypothetical protein
MAGRLDGARHAGAARRLEGGQAPHDCQDGGGTPIAQTSAPSVRLSSSFREHIH